MKVLVTGSSGHLGEGLVRCLRAAEHEVVSIDLLPSPFTSHVGSVGDRDLVRAALNGVEGVLHAATLHKPHVATHPREAFVAANVTGTLVLLEEAVAAGVTRFVFTSTTSTFGHALTPPAGAPAAWITEQVTPIPKNIYGVTKTSAEGLCRLVHQDHGLACLILRTSRFFPEADDRPEVAAAYDDENLKLNELLYRRVDVRDAVDAHLRALERAPDLGFGTYVISATTPFTPADLPELGRDAPAVLARHHPEFAPLYAERGWRMQPRLDRVYINAHARAELGWRPRHDFGAALTALSEGRAWRSELTRQLGSKGYHR